MIERHIVIIKYDYNDCKTYWLLSKRREPPRRREAWHRMSWGRPGWTDRARRRRRRRAAQRPRPMPPTKRERARRRRPRIDARWWAVAPASVACRMCTRVGRPAPSRTRRALATRSPSPLRAPRVFRRLHSTPMRPLESTWPPPVRRPLTACHTRCRRRSLGDTRWIRRSCSATPLCNRPLFQIIQWLFFNIRVYYIYFLVNLILIRLFISLIVLSSHQNTIDSYFQSVIFRISQ